jgi:hypothetical protein
VNVAIARRRGKAQEVIAGIEELGRRQPLATAAGGFLAGAAGAFALRTLGRRPGGSSRTSTPLRRPVGGTTAHSYGRDNPSGPGYNWPPEPAAVG